MVASMMDISFLLAIAAWCVGTWCWAGAEGNTRPMDRNTLFGATHRPELRPVRPDLSHVLQQSNYIINGQDARLGDHTSIVSIQVYINKTRLWHHLCGGAIVTETAVLTAAHCLSYHRVGLPHRVGAGWVSLKESRNPHAQNVHIKGALEHSGFNKSRSVSTDDIAILFLEKPLRYNRYVKPIKLPVAKQNFVGETCVVAGWGVVSAVPEVPCQIQGRKWIRKIRKYNITFQKPRQSTGQYSRQKRQGVSHSLADTLQETEAPVIPTKLCRRFWSLNGNAKIADSNLCTFAALYGGRQTNVCSGDSGGPLICSGYLAGLVSWGRKGCVGCSPDIYTRVAYFSRWIEDNTDMPCAMRFDLE